MVVMTGQELREKKTKAWMDADKTCGQGWSTTGNDCQVGIKSENRQEMAAED